MIRIAICDDEKVYCKHIYSLIHQKYQDIEINIFHSGKEFLSADNEYDIIFMDIDLKDYNGIKLLKKYNYYSSIIIILTSHEEEALHGYYIRAFRFLLKPIDKLLFFEALSSAINELKKKNHLIVTDEHGIMSNLSLENIVYIEAGDKKTGIRTMSGFYYSNIPINQIISLLNTNFYFVHRSYVINLNYIEKINTKSRTVFMKEESIISVSRLKWKDFKPNFFEFLKIQMKGE